MPTEICDVGRLAQAIGDGAVVAVPTSDTGPAMAVTRDLVRRRPRGLHLVCVPTSGLQADVMVGAGLIRTIETSAVTLGELGTGPRFAAAVRDGSVSVKDATCAAVHAALQAGQKGIPFLPLRGLLGTDVLAHRPDWKVIDNPFAADDAIVLVPAIRPDVALFHAPLADRFGNVFIGRARELLTMAHAAHSTLVSVERITEDSLLEDPRYAPAVIPALYVTRVAHAPRGAWPLRCGAEYVADHAALSRYAAAATSAQPAGVGAAA